MDDRPLTEFQKRVLRYLSQFKGGQQLCCYFGEDFYPEKANLGPAGGGPSRAATAAAWQLGKMAKATRLVEWVPDSRPSAYRLTRAGWEAAKELELEPEEAEAIRRKGQG